MFNGEKAILKEKTAEWKQIILGKRDRETYEERPE